MFKKRKKETDLWDLLGEEGYKKYREQEDMKMYEEMFKDFSANLPAISRKVDAFKIDPDNTPHGLSDELLVEMEVVHMKLTNALYRLRLGELQSRLNMKEIDILEYRELSDELFKKDNPYIYI